MDQHHEPIEFCENRIQTNNKSHPTEKNRWKVIFFLLLAVCVIASITLAVGIFLITDPQTSTAALVEKVGYLASRVSDLTKVVNAIEELLKAPVVVNTDIACSNDFCHDAYWVNSSLGDIRVDNPPLKDTVLIPVGGYAVVRVFTDSPGYWMAHCHQSEHLHEGMAMVLDVDGENAKPRVPNKFSICGDFVLKNE